MVLSGIMIRMNLTDTFVKLLSVFLKPLFRVRSSCIYVIFMGFLCGFPMGANVSATLYERKQLSKREAEFLLAFCNNIGPVYFVSFALPVAGLSAHPALLIGMYGLPVLYGLILRYTVYSDLPVKESPTGFEASGSGFLEALDDSVMSSLSAITRLGGYMIFFNLLNIFAYLFLPVMLRPYFSCFLEITGGLQLLGDKTPYFTLCLLPFGGLSCLAQTYSMIKNTNLSLKKYCYHKLALTLLSVVYYAVLL